LIARREGSVDAAQKELEEAVRASSENAAAQAELGTLYLQIGNLEQARSTLEQAIKVAPAISQYHYHLALAYTRLGLEDPAHREMETYNRLRQAEDEEHKRRTSEAPPPAAQP
jgi:Tfp pilus assembly protein PilF